MPKCFRQLVILLQKKKEFTMCIHVILLDTLVSHVQDDIKIKYPAKGGVLI